MASTRLLKNWCQTDPTWYKAPSMNSWILGRLFCRCWEIFAILCSLYNSLIWTVNTSLVADGLAQQLVLYPGFPCCECSYLACDSGKDKASFSIFKVKLFERNKKYSSGLFDQPVPRRLHQAPNVWCRRTPYNPTLGNPENNWTHQHARFSIWSCVKLLHCFLVYFATNENILLQPESNLDEDCSASKISLDISIGPPEMIQ